MTSLKAWCAALVLSTALIGQGAAQQPITIKFSHVTTADTPKGRAADFFRMRLEELSKGRVKVEVYPNATLIKDPDEFKALQEDRVQMLAPPLSKFGSLGVKEFEVFDVPYLFADQRMVQKVLAGPVGKTLFDKAAAQGVHGLAYWDNGFKIMSANRPLEVPADMKGLKLRIQNSRVIEAQMRALGGEPRVITLAQTYAALKSATLDGTENPPSNMYTQRIHDVQKYVAATNHGYLGYAVIVSKHFWNSLPADIQPLVEQAMRDATRYANSIARQENDDALAVIERSGKTRVARLSADQLKAWQQALLPVRREAEARVGREFMDMMMREVKSAGGSR